MKNTVILVILVAIGAGAFYSFKKGPEKTSFSVTYEVDCSDCNVTFVNEGGQTVQEKNVKSGWKYSFTGNKGVFVNVSAKNNQESGDVAVRINIDGEVVKQSRSDNSYTLALAGTYL